MFSNQFSVTRYFAIIIGAFTGSYFSKWVNIFDNSMDVGISVGFGIFVCNILVDLITSKIQGSNKT